MREFFAENRKSVCEFLKDKEGAVFFCGEPRHKVGDEFYPFTPDRNFYYLTGVGEAELVLFILNSAGKTEERLFIKRPDPEREKWTGAVIRAQQAEEISGISDISYTDEFETYFKNRVKSGDILNVYVDIDKQIPKALSPALCFEEKIKAELPSVKISDIHSFMASKRAIKSQCEAESIKKAIDITACGIYSMMKNARPDMYEYELEAFFDFELKSRGVFDKAFASIIAGGKNAAVLHYGANNSPIPDGSLVLCDVGAAWGYYSGDITRTFPINGRFTKRQRELYSIVLEGNLMIQDTIKPGLPFKCLNERLISYYEKALKSIGLIKLKDDVKKYYWHKVSHFLGLETHDTGRGDEGNIAEGMVFTVEPGLYIAEEAIGIRIEDDILVTDTGCINLSENIIKTPDDIEEFMK